MIALCLKFIYKLRTLAQMRRYAKSQDACLSLLSARNDQVEESKETFVKHIAENLPKYKDQGKPFADNRKLEFKGMVKLPNGDKYQGTWAKKPAELKVILTNPRTERSFTFCLF